MSILCVTPVWGPEYWDTFARTVLPAIGPQVQALDEPFDWLVYTERDDWRQWATEPAVKAIGTRWWIEHVNAKAMGPLGDGYQGMLDRLRHAINYAWDGGPHNPGPRRDTLLFLPPDVVYAEGGLLRAWEAMKAGAGAVLVPRIRVNHAPMQGWLRTWRRWSALPIEGGALARAAMENLHPLQLSTFVDADRFTTWPSNICRRTPQGMTVRGHHLFTLFAKPTNNAPDWTNPDFDFIERCVEPWSNTWIPGTSDELLAVDLTRDGHLSSGDDPSTNLIGRGPMNPTRVDTWLAGHAREFHRWLATHEYAVRAGLHMHEVEA